MLRYKLKTNNSGRFQPILQIPKIEIIVMHVKIKIICSKGGDMFRKIVGVFIVVGFLLSPPSQLYANEFLKGIVGTIIGKGDERDTVKRVIGAIIILGIMKAVIDNANKKSASTSHSPNQSNGKTNGYCQVWSYRQLTHQESCYAAQSCSSDSVCNFDFHWPSGSATNVRIASNQQITLNNRPSGVVTMGSDKCFRDGSADQIFCFSVEKQSPSMLMK